MGRDRRLLLAVLLLASACYPKPRTSPKVSGLYRVPPDCAEPVGHAVAYFTGDDGRAVAIADGVVVMVGATDPSRVGVGVMVDHSSAVGRWAQYDYLAEVRVHAGDTVRRGETLGWAVRPGHTRGVDWQGIKLWLPRISLGVCVGPCELATDDPSPHLDICMRQARPGEVIFPVVC